MVLQELDEIVRLAREVYETCATRDPPDASGMLGALREQRASYESMMKLAQALGLLRADEGMTRLEVEAFHNKIVTVLAKFPDARAAVEAAFDDENS
jgi:hypothetical protein